MKNDTGDDYCRISANETLDGVVRYSVLHRAYTLASGVIPEAFYFEAIAGRHPVRWTEPLPERQENDE